MSETLDINFAPVAPNNPAAWLPSSLKVGRFRAEPTALEIFPSLDRKPPFFFSSLGELTAPSFLLEPVFSTLVEFS